MLEIGGRRIGGEHFALIAGPCTVESRDQTADHRARRRAAPARRCSAAAPTSRARARTPSRGSGRRACGCSPRPRSETGLPIVTELMDARDLEPVLEVADVIQIGARNMQNYPLLAEIGRSRLPGADQARPVEHARGAADGRRVRAQGGQRERACSASAASARSRPPTASRSTSPRCPVLKELIAPAGDRRPEPRGRPARPRRAAVPRRRRGGRRRHHRRGAPRPRGGHLRRAAAAAHRGLRRLRAQVEAAAAVAGKTRSWKPSAAA